MIPLKIGITSPLVGNEEPTPDMGVVQHCIAAERGGAQPVILRNDMHPLSVIEEFGLAGCIFSGGGDIAAGCYGGDARLVRNDIDFRRDAFELALMENALKREIPILAVCRGMQIANVLLEGTLIEDILSTMGSAYNITHDQVMERGLPYHARVHEIAITQGTLLHAIAGADRMSVNSIHHQGIGTLGLGLRAVAHADDGVIEAIEFAEPRRGFFLGVQWHPEWLSDDPVSRCLYQKLIEACEFSPPSRPRKDSGFRDVKHAR